MARRKVYHVTRTGKGDWKVKSEDASKATSIHHKKGEAVEKAKKLAKGQPLGQVIIHKRTGEFQKEYTYRKG